MFSLQTHHFQLDHSTRQRKLVKTDPYIRLSKKDEGNVFLRNGRLYYLDGQEIDEPSEWIQEEMGKISPEALREVGFIDIREEPPANVSQKLWTCETCSQEMPLSHKGFHVARHRKGL